jgi:hypothetical protein
MGVEHPWRRDAECLIEAVYRKAFEATLGEHFPVLLGLADPSGNIVAAAGCRFAARDALFLERYLDEPIDVTLTRRQKIAVTRRDVAEIGNLATLAHGHIVPLFAALADYLHDASISYAVSTATRRLRRAFDALGFCDGELAKADPARVANGATDWGNYYAHAPAVVFGRVAEGRARLSGAAAGAMR